MKLMILALVLAVAAPASADRQPLVYAHRGGADLGPENTLGAFRQAHERFGARGVWLEMDTQLTADGDLVIMHDDTLNRTTNCSGTVISRATAYVTACDARDTFPSWPSFELVPLTHAVLQEGKASGWRVMIELKDIPYESNFDAACASADTLIDVVRDTGFPLADLIVQSFWPPCLERIKLREPGIRVAMLTTSDVGFTATENGAFSTARGFEIVAPDDGAPDLNAQTVSAIQTLGREVVVWTVDDPSVNIPRAIGWGVDGIISNRPDLVYAALDAS
jgi:glycerophosphoryl diester phosphodiesterase